MKTLAPLLVNGVLIFLLPNISVAEDNQTLSKNISESSWITFLSHRTGGNILYKMRPDGSQLTPILGGEIPHVPVLNDGVTLYREPHWTRLSPNRRYYCSWIADTGTPHFDHQGRVRFMLQVGDLDGLWNRILNADADESFAWSPDSTQIAFAIISGGAFNTHGYLRGTLPLTTEIGIVGIDGSNERYLLEQPDGWAVCDWSPDGKKILLQRWRTKEDSPKACGLFEFDLESALTLTSEPPYGGRQRGNAWAAENAPALVRELIPLSAKKDFHTVRYSPDGKHVAFIYADRANMHEPNGRKKRYLGKAAVLDTPTGETKTIADCPEGLHGPICWSPDGREILFSRYLPVDDDREKKDGTRAGLAIWAIGMDGGGARFLTTGWSPDWR